MEKEYRIAQGSEGKVANRSLRTSAIILILMPVLINAYSIAFTHLSIHGAIVSTVLSYLIFAGIIYTMRNFAVIINRGMVFRVSDEAITRIVDIDENELNFFQSYGWNRNKSRLKFISIPWSDIKSITDKGHSVLVKSQNSSTLDGRGMLMLPKEIEGFDELENIIRTRVAPYGVQF